MAVDSFARLLLFKLLKGGGTVTPPDPSGNTTAATYNALVDRVDEIDNALFANGYDIMAVSVGSTARKARAAVNAASYVPVDEYNDLEIRVSAIEALLTLDGHSIMQVVETDGGDNISPVKLPHANGEYVTEAEFAELVNHVDDLENMLSLAADRILAVRG